MKTTPKLKPFARNQAAPAAAKTATELATELKASIESPAASTEDTTMSTPKAPTPPATPAKAPTSPAPAVEADLHADAGTTTEIKAEAKPSGPVAATFAELKAAFGEDPAFVMTAQEKGWTMLQAFGERTKALQAQVSSLKTGTARLGNAADAGVEPVGINPKASANGSIDLTGRTPKAYAAAVEATMATEKLTAAQAADKLNKEHPEFRAACFAGGRFHA
ncbi:MAG TPA: hypothetical protein PLW65_20030 [Pseudomonadota bacterium]|nr:hypothetical protein [Pseudomonadota bacterium]